MSHSLVLASRETEQLRHTLNVISLSERSKIVGSAKYLIHKYPGDFDVFDYAVSKSNREEAAAEFAILISSVAKILSIDKSIQMIDFKAGEDLRFKFKELENETKDINIDRMLCFIERCRKEKLLTDVEAKTLSSGSYDNAKEFFRKLGNPHWKLDEIMIGKKKLRGDKLLTLKDAINANARVKLDTVTWFSSRMQIVEILYWLVYTDENGEEIPLFDPGNYVETLVKDINVFKLNNPLKTMKRLWSLSILLDCDKLINELAPIFSSDAAALNQIVADIEALKMIQKPLDKMMIVILETRRKMQNHLTPEEFHDEIGHEMNCTCDKIYDLWVSYKKNGIFDYQKFHEHLDWLEKFLKPLINKRAQPFYDRIKADVKYCVKTGNLLL